MAEERLWTVPKNELLIEQLMALTVYDLDRLEKCFMYEFKIHQEKSEEISSILEHTRAVRQGSV